MGRVKSNMELIKKEKTRNTTFEKRKSCLMKKVHELATLCGIKAAVIIYGPKQSSLRDLSPIQPEVWPENRDEVVELIDKYRSQTPEDRKKRTYLLTDFFEERNKKAQQVLTKLRKTNVLARYPTWDTRFDGLLEEQLRQVATFLEDKIGSAKAKLAQMKANNNDISRYYAHQLQLQQQRLSLNRRNMDFEAANQANNYFMTMNQHEPSPAPVPLPMPYLQQRHFQMDHCPKRRMLNFGGDYVGVGTSDVFYGGPAIANEVYRDLLMMGKMNGISHSDNLIRAPPLNYYSDPMGQCYMQYPHPPPMRSAGAASSSQMLVASQHQNDDLDLYNKNCNNTQYYHSNKNPLHMSQATFESSATQHYASDKNPSHMSQATFESSATQQYVSDEYPLHISQATFESSATQQYVSDEYPLHMSQATLEPSATRHYVSDKGTSHISQATLKPSATRYNLSDKDPSHMPPATLEPSTSSHHEDEENPVEFSF